MANRKCLDLAEDQAEALDKCLKRLDLDKLLGALFEFIEIFVKHTSQKEMEELL